MKPTPACRLACANSWPWVATVCGVPPPQSNPAGGSIATKYACCRRCRDRKKIICIGLNYADHARETGKEAPAEPVVFNKLQTALRAAGDPIVLPRLSSKVDYEAELVVVIGARGRHIPKEKALEYVAGYTCGNDVSARDWQAQKPGGQWLAGQVVR
jgi:2-keto-4-pentenoate hydratase/2-oxohepta-3-ene-1,7-dioic acid hydratase in catechol pathway